LPLALPRSRQKGKRHAPQAIEESRQLPPAEASLQCQKIGRPSQHYDLYDAGNWHDPEKRDAYIAQFSREIELRRTAQAKRAFRIVVVVDDDVVLDGDAELV
jgi:hypothetical protein